MDAETLERLLIDRALGALPADTEALLAAYLEGEEQATTQGKVLDQTVSLARQALADAAPPDAALPPFPKAKLARAQRTRRLRLATVQAAALAACVLIGFSVGGLGSNSLLPPEVPPPPERAQLSEGIRPAATVTIRPSAEITDSTYRSTFWSVQAWRERAAKDRPRRQRRLIWDSVAKWPRMGDS